MTADVRGRVRALLTVAAIAAATNGPLLIAMAGAR